MGNKEEELLTRVTQINLQQLRILARSLGFTNEDVMTVGTKSRLLKVVLRKLNSDDFDTPEGKKKLCEIHKFLMSAPVENSIKKLPTDSKHSNFPLLFFCTARTQFKQSDIFETKNIDGKIGNPDQTNKATFASHLNKYKMPKLKDIPKRKFVTLY